MTTAGVPGIPLAAMAAGGVLVWSGIYNRTITDTLSSLLRGAQPAPGPTEQLVVPNSSTAATGSGTANVPASDKTGTPTANKAAGELMAASYGWTGDNWLCLETGWQEESSWNQYAFNQPGNYNAAYGIPQANPGTKMSSAGSDWKTNPLTQIKWGLSYIKSTYGSPSRVPGWTPNGPSAGYVGY
jgi:hypothetical protein